MFQPSDIFEKISFARQTLAELAERASLPPGQLIYPDKRYALMVDVFPEAQIGGIVYRSWLKLVVVRELPKEDSFSEVTDGKPSVKRSRGAMVVVEQPMGGVMNWIFTILISDKHCPPHIVDVGNLAAVVALHKRTETIATEFLCACEAYKELIAGQRANIVPQVHPDFLKDTLPLIRPDEQLISSAVDLIPRKFTEIKSLLEYIAGDACPVNYDDSAILPFWEHWRTIKRVRKDLVARRIREMQLMLDGHPKAKFEPISASALKRFWPQR